MARLPFPPGFVWGVATSAQQIEGGRHDGGRADSIWDRFASLPGKIADGSTPDIACDHFHRWRDDVALMKSLGLGGYRFSLSWPRILPSGAGEPNEPGLDFYDALVDALLDAGIEPFPTLYHWDLPVAVQDRGGWGARETVALFADYAAVVARRLGDRVRRWTTHNEPWCVATLGHEEGSHAPGHTDPAEALRVGHHVLLSHAKAAAALRAESPGAEVGIALIHSPAHPATDTAADRDAARWFDGFFNRWYLDPLFRGAYPADAVGDRVAAGHLPSPELPFVKEGDLAAIAQPLDFLGINYYSRVVMRAGPDGRREAVRPLPPAGITDMDWEVYPDGLHETLTRIHREYGPPKLYVLENGAAYDDPPSPDGSIPDPRRIDYLRRHLLAARRALADGAPLAGYFVWTLMDNFEWGFGYRMKFGLFALDRDRRRVPRDSAFWYRDVIAANAVDDALTSARQGDSRGSGS